MILWQTFKESIKLPSKKALFKLNRTGMDITVVYMFVLLLFVSLPALIDRLTTTSTVSGDTHTFFIIIYFFIFYYLPMNVIIFLMLTILAYICLGITKLMRRKLRFAIVWKMSAYATTIPFIVYAIIAFFRPVSQLFLWLSILYTLIILIKMISIYPKRRKR